MRLHLLNGYFSFLGYFFVVFVAFVVIAFVVQRAVVDFGNNKDLTFHEWVTMYWSRFVQWCRKVFKKK
jgi:hypothetical protein